MIPFNRADDYTRDIRGYTVFELIKVKCWEKFKSHIINKYVLSASFPSDRRSLR